MSLAVTKALYARLAGDAELASKLVVHNAKPAIFTTQPYPSAVTLPQSPPLGVVTISGARAVDSRPAMNDRSKGPRTETRDVTVWAALTGSGLFADLVGDMIETLLDGATLEVEGMPEMTCQADPALEAEADETAIGRIVTVKVKWQR